MEFYVSDSGLAQTSESANKESWARHGGAVVKVLALHARDPIWALVLIPAALLLIQLPACGPGKAV